MRLRRCTPFLFALALLGCGTAGDSHYSELTIGDDVLRVERADTPAERQQGLSGRPSLPPGEGLLLIFETADYHAIWMKGMQFDIDIVWIRDGRIVNITPNVPHVTGTEPLTIYRPAAPVDAVLEVVAGEATRRHWKYGMSVRLENEDSVQAR